MEKKSIFYVMLVLFLPIGILFWICASWQVMTLFLIASALLIIMTNTDKIQTIGLGKDNVKLTMKEAKEVITKTEKVNKQLEVTIDKLNTTVTPLLDFSLGLLEKDGEMDNITKFDYVESFLTSAVDLYKDMGELDNETKSLIAKCNAKLVNSFQYELEMYSPDLEDEVFDCINIYPELSIDFEELESKKNNLSSKEIDRFEYVVERMKTYYEKNIK